MGRKKQTIISSGGIIGDSIDKTVDFMMGRVDNLPSRDQPLLFENENNYQSNKKNKIHNHDLIKNKFFSQTSNFKNAKLFFEEENTNKDCQNDSFNYEGSISELDIEGLDSDMDFEESMRQEGIKESFEVLHGNLELDLDDMDLSSVESQEGINNDVSMALKIENHYNHNELKILPDLRLQEIKVKTNLIPLSSLDVIEPRYDNDLYSDDKDSLVDLVEKLDDLKITGDGFKVQEMNLNIKQLDIKYDFGGNEDSVNEILGKRKTPDDYSWNFYSFKQYKKIKTRLYYSEVELDQRGDNFYNLLIDRYRFNIMPT